MINDTDRYTLDKEFNLLLINDDPDIVVFKTVMMDSIKQYIDFHDIARVGVTIVANNALDKMTEPSGEGTMLNLYNMFYHYFHQMEENQIGGV